jgi:hypothetical protein
MKVGRRVVIASVDVEIATRSSGGSSSSSSSSTTTTANTTAIIIVTTTCMRYARISHASLNGVSTG